ncbi:MAG: hypothetical protein IPP35_11120 [Elusimicrobia bacterium]|nr:hypothetical protein [Elusimicrobiota bacterium]
MDDRPYDRPAADSAVRFRAFQTLPSSMEAQRDFLNIIGSLGGLTAHPAGKEMNRVALWNGKGECEVFGFEECGERGFGGAVQLPGETGPRLALVGSRELLSESGMAIPDLLGAATREWAGDLILYAGWDGQARGVLRFSSI